MAYANRFSDPDLIESRIDNGTMTSQDAKLALEDLKTMYDFGAISYDKFQYLKMKLEDIID